MYIGGGLVGTVVILASGLVRARTRLVRRHGIDTL